MSEQPTPAMTLSQLSPSAAAELLLLRRRIRSSFEAWCIEALAIEGLSPARHHLALIRELEDLAAGNNDRLMVFMPPGHAKSTYVSHLFPGWLMARRPRTSIIAGTHTISLAEKNGRYARNYIALNAPALGYDLDPNLSAMTRWATSNGGEYLGAGVGKAIAGFRAALGILDDLVPDQEAAESALIREKTWDWYRKDFTTRLLPTAPVVLLMTRWHEDDIAGRLIQAMKDGTGEAWRILNLPAIAEEDDQLGRTPGEALWPEEYNLSVLSRRRLVLGERDFAALYQQHPRPAEGAIFKTSLIEAIDIAPAKGNVCRAWDLAATAQTGTRDPDWTVGVKLMRTSQGGFIVLDVARFRGGPEEVEARIIATAQQDGYGVRVSLPQDPGQAGKSQVLYLTRKLAGYRVHSNPETGSKETRAAPVASQVNVGNVQIVRANWNPTFLDELAGFPTGTKDDQVDALSRAFALVGMNRVPMLISDEALTATALRA